MLESRKSRLAGKNGKSSVILKKFAVSVVVKLRSSFILQNDRKALGWFSDQYFLKMSDDIPPSLSPKFLKNSAVFCKSCFFGRWFELFDWVGIPNNSNQKRSESKRIQSVLIRKKVFFKSCRMIMISQVTIICTLGMWALSVVALDVLFLAWHLFRTT